MDHPIIRKMERDGFLEEDELISYDFFGNPIHQGDTFYQLDDEKFLEEELPQEAREVLIWLGAKKVCATNTDK